MAKKKNTCFQILTEKLVTMLQAPSTPWWYEWITCLVILTSGYIFWYWKLQLPRLVINSAWESWPNLVAFLWMKYFKPFWKEKVYNASFEVQVNTNNCQSNLLYLIHSIWGVFTSLCCVFPNSENLHDFWVTPGIRNLPIGAVLQNQGQRYYLWCSNCSRILDLQCHSIQLHKPDHDAFCFDRAIGSTNMQKDYFNSNNLPSFNFMLK